MYVTCDFRLTSYMLVICYIVLVNLLQVQARRCIHSLHNLFIFNVLNQTTLMFVTVAMRQQALKALGLPLIS